MEYKWNTGANQRPCLVSTDKPALANETKIAYPFVRTNLTKGFCVCCQGQKPPSGPLHCQSLRREKRQSIRAAATPAESSGAPGCRPTPSRTSEPVSWRSEERRVG